MMASASASVIRVEQDRLTVIGRKGAVDQLMPSLRLRESGESLNCVQEREVKKELSFAQLLCLQGCS